MSKFDFLEEQYPELYEMCVEVEEGIKPYDKAHKARKVIERITKTFITTPNLSLTKRIDKLRKDGIIKEEMYVRFVVVRALGNDASHEDTAGNVTDMYIPMLMDHLYRITQWYVSYCGMSNSQKKKKSKKEIKKEKELIQQQANAQKKSKRMHDVNFELWELGNRVYERQGEPVRITSSQVKGYLNKATQAKARNDHKQMFNWYLKAAREESVDGQFEVGYCYHYGIGTEQDHIRAAGYYKKALKQGCHSALPFLKEVETYLLIEKKYKKIAEYLSKAQHTRNNFNEKEAIEWYRKAVQEGSAEGMFELGYCYYYGIGIEENRSKAIEYYRSAESLGHEKAHQNVIAIETLEKDILRQNEIEYWKEKARSANDNSLAFNAFTYYKKALELGDIEAHYIIGCYLEEGYGCGYNNKRAAQLYQVAAEFGIADAQYRLGFCYEFAKGISKNYDEANKWYIKALRQGHADSKEALKRVNIKRDEQEIDPQKLYDIGIRYRNNSDDETAVLFYQKAARKGQRNAMYILGICYEFGHGVKANVEKAIDYYRQATHMKYQPAQQALERVTREDNARKESERRAREIELRKKEQTETRPAQQYAIANRYHKIGDYTEALFYYQKAACQGYAKAIHTIGQYYEFGYCGTKDIEEAVRWYGKAKDMGYAFAKLDLIRIKNQKSMREDMKVL